MDDCFNVEPFGLREEARRDDEESLETRDKDDPLAALCDVTYGPRAPADLLGKGEAARLLLDWGEEAPVWPNRSSHMVKSAMDLVESLRQRRSGTRQRTAQSLRLSAARRKRGQGGGWWNRREGLVASRWLQVSRSARARLQLAPSTSGCDSPGAFQPQRAAVGQSAGQLLGRIGHPRGDVNQERGEEKTKPCGQDIRATCSLPLNLRSLKVTDVRVAASPRLQCGGNLTPRKV